MFCNKCGVSNSDDSRFCVKCGNPLEKNIQTAQQDPKTLAAQPPEGALALSNKESVVKEPDEKTEVSKKPSLFKPIYVIPAIIFLTAIIGAFIAAPRIIDAINHRNILSEAETAVGSGDLELAVELCRGALLDRPEDQSARNILDAALSDMLDRGLIEAKTLAANGEADAALETLRALPISKEDKQFSQYSDCLDALSSRPSTAVVDSAAFPTISIYIEAASGTLEASEVSVTDSGNDVLVSDEYQNSGGMVISYTAEDSPDGGERRDVLVNLTIGEFTFPVSGDYITPEPKEANVTLVSTDFTDYPTVRAFFQVKDTHTGQHIENIGLNSFVISESVSGGAYVAREVKSAESMAVAGSKYGLHIALVADKSDSIGRDMSKIKTVMREFVGSLAFADGDRAELIAFDDVPQLMCTFTDDATLLYNGINNMSIDGMTAFYDAVYQGVRNTALQGGAKCVIAFTDGADNMSRHSARNVISFANEKQVPLYIIGVGNDGDPSHGTLREMASQTQGRYWYIDDLYDLSEIYRQIYSELRELYVVSYESDGVADAFAERGLQVSMRSGGYKGVANPIFSPAKTAGAGGGSRYEIFVEDVSWEEASERCLERGGHLVTITSEAEESLIIDLAEKEGARFVWLGGYTSYDNANNVFAHWITGEEFTYANWMQNEPSRHDRDGTPEWYLMMWDVTGEWTWNDQREELVSVFPYYKGKIAYVCEYE